MTRFTVTGCGETPSLWTALIVYIKFQLYLHIHSITQQQGCLHCNVMYALVLRLITAIYYVLLYITWWTSVPVWWLVPCVVRMSVRVCLYYITVQCCKVSFPDPNLQRTISN